MLESLTWNSDNGIGFQNAVCSCPPRETQKLEQTAQPRAAGHLPAQPSSSQDCGWAHSWMSLQTLEYDFKRTSQGTSSPAQNLSWAPDFSLSESQNPYHGLRAPQLWCHPHHLLGHQLWTGLHAVRKHATPGPCLRILSSPKFLLNFTSFFHSVLSKVRFMQEVSSDHLSEEGRTPPPIPVYHLLLFFNIIIILLLLLQSLPSDNFYLYLSPDVEWEVHVAGSLIVHGYNFTPRMVSRT